MDKKEIDNLVMNTVYDNHIQKINNIYLSNKQVQILDKYSIDYQNKLDIKELIFEIEEYINENSLYSELDDLENLSMELSEFNYYHNTNK